MELKSRKPTRLKEYDYSTEGAYFVTICAKNRQNIFSVVGDDANIVPTQIGLIVEKYIKSIPGIEKYVIMPNHIHMIIIVDRGTMLASSPTQDIPQRVKSFKILATKEIGHSVFQRSYHDHIIRNNVDYLDAWKYIDDNPAKWQSDDYYMK